MGLRQTKHIPPALPVSGTLSSSNPDLLQSHHRILDFNTTPGKNLFFIVVLDFLISFHSSGVLYGFVESEEACEFLLTAVTHKLVTYSYICYNILYPRIIDVWF